LQNKDSTDGVLLDSDSGKDSDGGVVIDSEYKDSNAENTLPKTATNALYDCYWVASISAWGITYINRRLSDNDILNY